MAYDIFGASPFLGQVNMAPPPGSKTPPVSAETAYRMREEDPDQWARILGRMSNAQKCYLYIELFLTYGEATDEGFGNLYCDFAGLNRRQVYRDIEIPSTAPPWSLRPGPRSTPTSTTFPAPMPPPSQPLTPTGGLRPRTTTTQKGNVIFSPSPVPPVYPSVTTASLPRYTDVPPSSMPSYGIDLQKQIDSYQAKLMEVYGTPTPTQTTASKPVEAPSEPISTLPPGECPPGQFLIDPMHPEKGCRGGVATGGLPGLPFGSASVMPGAIAPTGGVATSFGGMGGRFPVVNL